MKSNKKQTDKDNLLVLVESIDDLKTNMENTEVLLQEKNTDLGGLLKRGRNFVHYMYNGQDRFLPSRYIGYKNISITKHEKGSNKHGSRTDCKLDKILRNKPKESDELKKRLETFIKKMYGSTLNQNKHSFWESGVCLKKNISLKEIEENLYKEAEKINFNRQGNPPDFRSYGKIKKTSPRYTRQIDYFDRDPQVVADALWLANGICQGCGAECLEYGKETKVFKRPDGTAFLEVHHIKPLSEGGLDVLENACAICPTCHRLLHHGQEKDKKKIIVRIEKSREERLKELKDCL